MKVAALMAPGRFPTVDHDPGLWWGAVAAKHEAVRYGANAAWWRGLCEPQAHGRLRSDLAWSQRLRGRLELSAAGLPFGERARAAARTLSYMGRKEHYASDVAFISGGANLAAFLETLNACQSEMIFGLGWGARVKAVDYADSASLCAYARRDTALSVTIEDSLRAFPVDAGFVAFSATSAEDLLTALIAARLLRRRMPRAHLCLADHGYENFSLQPHMQGLRESARLLGFFDSVVESKDEKDALVPALVAACARGAAPKGFLTARDFPMQPPPAAGGATPPADRAFSPERVFWTRVSPRRCYWSRCSFCAQNNKYDDPRPPSRSEIAGALGRLEALAAAGTRTFIFSDEALSPAMLRLLADGITERGLDIRWSCRSKLELSHTPELFESLARSGCYEVLYGLESISPRVQKLMSKHTRGLDAAAIKRIFLSMGRAGVGTHVNLIGGHPGDAVVDVEETVDFLLDVLPSVDSTTYVLNQFALFPDTPILLEPGRYGIVPAAGGDMASSYAFTVAGGARAEAEAEAVLAALPRLRKKLHDGLGWDRFGRGAGAEAAMDLYFGSGQGAVMKAGGLNPFANPLRQGEKTRR